jgi:hypothetical protein
MNGGVARKVALWCIPAVMALASLGGCSVFRPAPPPAPEPVAPPPVVASEPAAPASAAVPASAPPAPVAEPEEASDNNLHTLQRIKRYIKKRLQPRPPAPPPPPAPSGPPPIITIRLVPHDVARGLLDADVQRPDGKVIGRAVDLMVDESGKPQAVVVNLTGFMGVGDVKTEFPWSDLRFDPTNRKTPVTLALPAGGAPLQRKPGGSEAPVGVLDSTVEDKSGTRVGRVVDVLLDKLAQPQAIVFDVGNTIGPNRHNIAAEWSAVRLVPRDKSLQLQMDLTDAQIKAAPPYASDQAARVIAPIAPPAAPASAPHNAR